jgi:hypothetical protein
MAFEESNDLPEITFRATGWLSRHRDRLSSDIASP